jgi:hypothetical protein
MIYLMLVEENRANWPNVVFALVTCCCFAHVLTPYKVLTIKERSTLQASFLATSDLPFTDIISEHWTT